MSEIPPHTWTWVAADFPRPARRCTHRSTSEETALPHFHRLRKRPRPSRYCSSRGLKLETGTLPFFRPDLSGPDYSLPQGWFPQETGKSICRAHSAGAQLSFARRGCAFGSQVLRGGNSGASAVSRHVQGLPGGCSRLSEFCGRNVIKAKIGNGYRNLFYRLTRLTRLEGLFVSRSQTWGSPKEARPRR